MIYVLLLLFIILVKADPNYNFAQQSGGKIVPPVTVNDEAAAMFVLGKEYNIDISAAD